MTIPASLVTELTNLQAQVIAAKPLQSASQPTIVAIQLNAAQLVSDIAAALLTAAGQLDTFIAPADPAAIVTGILGLLGNAQDQANLANWIGYVGRSNKNIDQLVP